MRKLLTLSTAVLAASTGFAQQKPNIVFILADDLGYGDISAFNPESKIQTPNIDNLTRCGVTFTDAHASSALSTPSRYGIMTGRYAWRTEFKEGVLGGYSGPMIKEGRRTIANMLSDCGYNTACIGKWHLGWDWTMLPDAKNEKDVDFTQPFKNGPMDRGFDYHFGIPASLDIAPYVYVENNRVTALPDHEIAPDKGLNLMHGGVAGADFEPVECLGKITEHCISYINSQKGSDKPFFVYMPITAPHTPVLPTEEFQGKTPIGAYGDFVVMIDDVVRQVVGALRENGQLENTIVVFTSDNGCAPYVDVKGLEKQGHYPSYIYRGYKSDIYEGGHRIPLIVSWEGHLKGRENSSLVSLTDFYATFAEMTGSKLAANEAEDSFSLWPILTGKKKSVRKDMIYQSGKGFLAYRTDEYKLVFHGGSGGWSYPSSKKDLKDKPAIQLFNLDKDAAEKRNMIKNKSNDELVEEFTRKIIKDVKNGRSTPGKKVKNDTGDCWKQIEIFMK